MAASGATAMAEEFLQGKVAGHPASEKAAIPLAEGVGSVREARDSNAFSGS